MQWAGAAFMLYLGFRMIGVSLSSAQASAVAPVSDWVAIREGCINSLTNPKSLLFMFAFLPLFVDPAAGPIWLQLLILGIIQKFVGVLSLGAVALASGTVGQWLRRWPQLLVWQKRFTGAILVGLGLRLLVSGGHSVRP